MHQSLQKKAINWLAQEVRLLQTKVQELEARAAPGTPPTNSSGRLPPSSPEKVNRPVRLNLSEILCSPAPKRFAFDPQAPVFCPTVPAFHDLKPPAGQELYSNDGGCVQQNCNESLKGNDGMALVQNQGNCPGGLSQDILDSLAVRQEDIQSPGRCGSDHAGYSDYSDCSEDMMMDMLAAQEEDARQKTVAMPKPLPRPNQTEIASEKCDKSDGGITIGDMIEGRSPIASSLTSKVETLHDAVELAMQVLSKSKEFEHVSGDGFDQRVFFRGSLVNTLDAIMHEEASDCTVEDFDYFITSLGGAVDQLMGALSRRGVPGDRWPP